METTIRKITMVGGFYEQLIAILKSALWKIVGSAKLNFWRITYSISTNWKHDEYKTSYLFIQRELWRTHHSISLHVWSKYKQKNIVDDIVNVVNLYKTLIKTRINYVTAVTNHFWNRFYIEYLYHKNNTNEKRELKINDVVLIQDNKITSHNNWRREKWRKR